jgi:uncharacterized protein YukE
LVHVAQAELRELLDVVGEVDAADIESRRVKMLGEHKSELANLSNEFRHTKAEAFKNAELAVMAEQARLELDLKERHYQELADAFRDFVPVQQRSSQSAKEIEEQLDMTRKHLEDERAQARSYSSPRDRAPCPVPRAPCPVPSSCGPLAMLVDQVAVEASALGNIETRLSRCG